MLFRTSVTIIAVCAIALWGQAAGPSFEVATIHPAPPMETIAQQIEQGKLRVGISIGQARVEIGFLSVGDMIPVAYGVTPYAVAGPEWMKTSRWDIVAKMPEGASKGQVPEMLQSLLASRFHLRVHKESREQNVYALIEGKEGARFHAADPIPAAAPTGREVMSTAQGQLQEAGDGAMVWSGGVLGRIRVTMPDDRDHLMHMAMNVSMARLTELLASLVDKPVVDMTGLRGEYAVTLALPGDGSKGVLRFAAGLDVIPMPDAARGNSSVESVFDAVKKLGLRLEARKVPMDMIVVDHVDKTPTEN